MDDISWTEFNPEEQRAIAVLGAGMPVGLCDATAIRRLRRDGFVRGSRLTRKAGRLRKAAILQTLAAIESSMCRSQKCIGRGVDQRLLKTTRGPLGDRFVKMTVVTY
jgi:hypothetical protein